MSINKNGRKIKLITNIAIPNIDADLSNPKYETKYPEMMGPINSPAAKLELNLNYIYLHITELMQCWHTNEDISDNIFTKLS